jgi:hypothetical protein
VRKQLSAPVSLMAIVIGAALSYYVLHANGLRMSGEVFCPRFTEVCRSLPFQSRAMVMLGFILNAWGLGRLPSALVLERLLIDRSG